MVVATKSTALAIPDRRQELKELLSQYPPAEFILLTPSTEFGFSPMFRPVISEVRINTDKDSKDVYAPGGGRGGEVALHATALNRISNALAVTWESTHVDESKRWKWRAEAAGWILHPNGDRIRHVGRYTLDVSDDEAVIIKRIHAKVGKQQGTYTYSASDAQRDIDSYRQFGEQRAETGARSRVIQWAANLQKTYTAAELSKKTFAALHWRPDERHPQVAAALIRRMENASDQVFGNGGNGHTALTQGTIRDVDAGEGSEDDVVGSIDTEATEQLTEPAIPEAPPQPAQPKVDINAIAAAANQQAKAIGDQSKAADTDLVNVGVALRDVLQLTGKLDQRELIAVRLSVIRALYGADIKASSQISRGQANVIVAWSKDAQRQGDLEAIFRHQLEHDAQNLAGIAAKVPQQTLLAAAKDL